MNDISVLHLIFFVRIRVEADPAVSSVLFVDLLVASLRRSMRPEQAGDIESYPPMDLQKFLMCNAVDNALTVRLLVSSHYLPSVLFLMKSRYFIFCTITMPILPWRNHLQQLLCFPLPIRRLAHLYILFRGLRLICMADDSRFMDAR